VKKGSKQFADNELKDTEDNKAAGQDLTGTAMGRQPLCCAAYILKDKNYVREEERRSTHRRSLWKSLVAVLNESHQMKSSLLRMLCGVGW
jgi:hypothetical protein